MQAHELNILNNIMLGIPDTETLCGKMLLDTNLKTVFVTVSKREVILCETCKSEQPLTTVFSVILDIDETFADAAAELIEKIGEIVKYG